MSKPPSTDMPAALEALLFIQSAPLSRRNIQQTLTLNEQELDIAIQKLQKRLEGRGVILITSSQGLELAVAPKWRTLTAHANQHTAPQLSQSSLEVLAIIAYDGPVSKQTIDEIRGIASDSSLRALLSRDLVTQRKTPSGPSYDLTSLAWRHLGLAGRIELPNKPRGTNATE